MKTIGDHLAGLFRGKLETITASELKKHMGDCLSQTAAGKSFCVKRKGRIVGFLVPPVAADITHEIAADGSCVTLSVEAASEDHDALVAGEKVCGECDGKRFVTQPLFKQAYRCPTCLGRGKYTYRPSGQRVAWDSKRKEWVAT